MLIGTIKEIVRHPVKSFSGESVQQSKVMDYGLYGDRSHAILDDSRPGKFLTITQFPEMVLYKATFNGIDSLKQYPKVEIMTPEGSIVEWGSEELKKEIESKSSRKISTREYIPTHVPLGAIEEEHLLLVTDASLKNLKETWGGREVDVRRFRPNLFLSLNDKIPFMEEQWFGKRLKIGKEVEIELKRHCERCMIVTVDPETSEKDPSLLKTIVKERNNHFGVYASVVNTGEINVGDGVWMIN